ncbi:MAG: TetR/AcrR family transcriptional regulator [Acidimicrobiia bacterium]|nr:TetR/AcrR family transcriptional regulator [Acidimicrobiia bacterium]
MTTDDRILAATLQLIVEQGVAGLSMSAIATRAGVVRQTLYNHYPDIESVVYAATVAHQQDSYTQLAAVLGTIESPAARLEHLVRHKAALSGHGHPDIKGGFSPPLSELVAEHDMAVRELVADTLRSGRDRGDFRPDLDLDVDPLLIQRMIESCGELVAASPDDMGGIVTAAVRSVLAAVGSDQGTDRSRRSR